MYGPQVGVCRVCGELTDSFSNAICMRCASPFHLALRQDIPAKDCGQVWIDEESQTLDFACDICLGRVEEPAVSETPAVERSAYARREGLRASEVVRRRRVERRRRGL